MAEKQSACVTPPGLDHSGMRTWMLGVMTGKDWTDLEWREETDSYGRPMGRLYGYPPGHDADEADSDVDARGKDKA